MITLITLLIFQWIGQDTEEIQNAQNGNVSLGFAAMGWNMIVEFIVELCILIGKVVKIKKRSR